MSRTERLVVGVLFAAVLLLAPAFLLHTSPRFAGSPWGAVLGILAALLMVLLLVYPLAKHIAWLKQRVTAVVSMAGLLRFHVYSGIIGALLGILHTGHKYQSALGISLVAVIIVVVFSGFVARYYLPVLSVELKEQQRQLTVLRQTYDRWAGALANPGQTADLPKVPLMRLVDGIADLEIAINTRSALQRSFTAWMIAHVVSALVMYLLLALHIAGEIYYGLRWLP
jgi:hypothetical protein